MVSTKSQLKKNPANREKRIALLLENIHDSAREFLESEGYDVETLPKSLSENELSERLENVSILGVRSNTTVSKHVLEHAKQLVAVGAFCIGTNRIDLGEATRRGIAVFNAPFSNTRSVAELVIAEIIALNRKLTDKNAAAHRGEWGKSAAGCHEVRGQRLGIVGYGNVGSQISVLAESLGMQVGYFDVVDKLSHGNAQRYASMHELLKDSDAITVHVDGRAENKGLFGEKEFAAMRPGSMFLNLSRGSVVDIDVLKEHLESGHLAGAAIDVFPVEPKAKGEKFVSSLQGMPNVILTPHVGSGTEEAQEHIGRFVSGKLRNYVKEGTTYLSVNLPSLRASFQPGAHRLTLMHRNVPGVLAKVNTRFAVEGINIAGQHLGTSGEAGYAIIDTDTALTDRAIKFVSELPETIRLSILE
jgi:D-3-phosphoglycerate dehydrogenase / 2-oxoglutarate reductase